MKRFPERPRETTDVTGGIGIRLFELAADWEEGTPSAEAWLMRWTGSEWTRTHKKIRIHDATETFTGAEEDKVWAHWSPNPTRWEIITAAGGGGASLKLFRLTAKMQGGIAPGVLVDPTTLESTGEVITVSDETYTGLDDSIWANAPSDAIGLGHKRGANSYGIVWLQRRDVFLFFTVDADRGEDAQGNLLPWFHGNLQHSFHDGDLRPETHPLQVQIWDEDEHEPVVWEGEKGVAVYDHRADKYRLVRLFRRQAPEMVQIDKTGQAQEQDGDLCQPTTVNVFSGIVKRTEFQGEILTDGEPCWILIADYNDVPAVEPIGERGRIYGPAKYDGFFQPEGFGNRPLFIVTAPVQKWLAKTTSAGTDVEKGASGSFRLYHRTEQASSIDVSAKALGTKIKGGQWCWVERVNRVLYATRYEFPTQSLPIDFRIKADKTAIEVLAADAETLLVTTPTWVDVLAASINCPNVPEPPP